MSPREKIAAAAQAMLDGGVGLLEGCRQICYLRFQLPEPEQRDEHLLFIAGISSELDECPSGRVRELWDPAVLAHKDHERDMYVGRVKDDLLTACRALAMRQ